MSKSPMAPVVYVSETAFLQMLVAAAEVFPHAPGTKRTRLQDGETFGYLFGTASRSHGRLVHRVDFVVPCQRVASRTASSVDSCAIGKKRVTGLIEPFPGLMLLGTFHSHPYDHAKVVGSASPRSPLIRKSNHGPVYTDRCRRPSNSLPGPVQWDVSGVVIGRAT